MDAAPRSCTEQVAGQSCLYFMNTRWRAVIVVFTFGLSLWVIRTSFRRDHAELTARINQMEEQIQTLRQVAGSNEQERLKGENERLRAENAELKNRTGQSVPVMMDPRTRLTVRKDEANDPLAFYRRNPELMKRYFPQLYKAEVEKQSEEIPAPPSE
jgi:regulator of replication initiation timing